MAIIKKQYYGIKFPLTANNLNGFFIDLNSNKRDKVASEIAHVLLTPKRTRIRKPDFGTDLIKFIFEPNTEIEWEQVKQEAVESVAKYVPAAELKNVEVVTNPENPEDIFLDLIYAVRDGNKIENNRLAIKL